MAVAWSNTCQLSFNVSKCFFKTINRKGSSDMQYILAGASNLGVLSYVTSFENGQERDSLRMHRVSGYT